jgi:hypothetical protein
MRTSAYGFARGPIHLRATIRKSLVRRGIWVNFHSFPNTHAHRRHILHWNHPCIRFRQDTTHTRVGEGLIDDTRLTASAQSSLDITTIINKAFSPDEDALFKKMQKILQFFLKLLQVAGGDLNIATCA